MKLPTSDTRDRLTLEGAKLLVGRNLRMKRGQELVIIVDETTLEVSNYLAVASNQLFIKPTILVVPEGLQEAFDSPSKLPLPLLRATEAAQAIAFAISDAPVGTGFRVAILDSARGNHCKIAHMPGITVDMLRLLTKTDYEMLENVCEALRPVLLLGDRVHITTYTRSGEAHHLEMDLGIWKQYPTVSTGIVRPNSFDNVPSGETFVAPIKGTANGSVVINGSVTGYVFDTCKEDEVVIGFSDGEIASIEPRQHIVASFLNEQIRKAKQKGDQEPGFLCELGIGVNTAIEQLTGNTLLDEKAYGTAHIAIGANEHFGGDVLASQIHEDLVFRNPTIKIDGLSVCEQGRITLSDQDWHPSYRRAETAGSAFADPSCELLWADSCEVGVGPGKILERIYIDGIGIRSHVAVGDNETARLACDIYRAVPQTEAFTALAIAKRLEWPVEKVQAILYIMGRRYGLLYPK